MPNTALFPACFVEMPPYIEGRSATFFLAAEEYVARCKMDESAMPEDDAAYLFTWQLHPTVVMGRNQVAHQEVDLDFCAREGIEVVRRKSGGGAIFADERNIMTSLVTRSGAVEPIFQAYAHAVSAALNAMGATTTVSGRNDILLTYERDGETMTGKICGNAFYHFSGSKKQGDFPSPFRRGDGGGSIVHGTMLYDTDPRLMQGALHPDLSKLQASGVKSVRSRVALLKDVLPFGVDELRRQLRERLTNRSIVLDDEDVRRIEEIEREYRTEEFLYGRKATQSTVLKRRIEGVGTLEVSLQLHNGRIEALHLSGDFFETGAEPAETAFRQAFEGHPFTPAVLRERIAAIHPERAIRNLTAEALVAMLEDPKTHPQPLPTRFLPLDNEGTEGSGERSLHITKGVGVSLKENLS